MRRQLDPPDHTRLRSLVNKAFTRQAVNLLEPRIRGLMAALLDDIDDPAGFDLMKAVANPLPVTVIGEMLGVPPEDRARFTVWSNQRAHLKLYFFLSARLPDPLLLIRNHIVTGLTLISERRRWPSPCATSRAGGAGRSSTSGLAMRVAAMWAAGLRSLPATDPGSALACGNSVACLTSPPSLFVVRGHDLT